jgi:nicotinate phosphoribosyltransferase
VNALLTDLYELTMAASYLRRGIEAPATFSLFVRRLPQTRGFLVGAGVESCLEFLQQLRFEDEDLRYLRETTRFDPGDLERLGKIRFTGDVWAVPEGRVVLAGEPLLELTAPIAEAQLVETFLLNRVTFETTIASKAARCVVAAQGQGLVDFSFRRTQGIEAGIAVARLSAMVGFQATSNVEAARRHGLGVSGTMAHSYVESFPSELEAFRTFARDFPERVTFLVDTYDTMGGVRNAIAAIKEEGLSGQLAVRLDSGNLLALSRQSRRLLDQAGLSHVGILASGGLDELAIEALVNSGAPIDAFGVGTKMGVSADSPFLDTAYKLVQLGDQPVMKLSKGKTTAPGRKQIFRRTRPWGDLVGLRNEPVPAGRVPLLEPMMVRGQRVANRSSLDEARTRFQSDLSDLPQSARDLKSPKSPMPRPTSALRRLTVSAREEASARSRQRD